MRIELSIIALLILTACATPVTTLQKNNKSVSCGGSKTGSWTGGVIGYHVQKGYDQDCVKRYLEEGYTVTNEEK